MQIYYDESNGEIILSIENFNNTSYNSKIFL